MKMLITDDDPVSRNILHAILLPYGRCDRASDGKEALEKFESAWQEQKPYTLVCLDVQMPEMDGQETLRRMRALEERMGVAPREKARVIMITVARDLENVRTAYQSRCEAYLVKPVEKDRLLEELARLNLS